MAEEENEALDTVHDEAVLAMLKYSTEQFDKNVLYIASGSLGISFAFIEKIIPDLISASCKWALFYSWYLFAGVIFLSLISHFISGLAQRWAYINAKKPCAELGTKIWNLVIRGMNIIMIIGLFAGLLFLIYFIRANTTPS